MKQRFDAALELKFVAETGAFEGYASVFNVGDSAGDMIVQGAFTQSLKRWQADNRLPPLLWQHDTQQPIGAWREIYEDAHGLFVKGDLFISDIARAKEAYKLMRESVVTGLSIGYKVRQSHRDQKTGLRVLTDVELMEISMVTFPANDHARVMRVKSKLNAGETPDVRECEAVLREAGFSRKQAKSLLAVGHKGLLAPDSQSLPLCDARAESDIAALRFLTDVIVRLT